MPDIKYAFACVNGGTLTLNFPEYLLTASPSVPGWVTYSGAVDVFGVQVIITNAPGEGTFIYDFGQFTLKIFVNADCFTTYDPCCRNNNYFNISWINIYGGRQNYIFDGVYTLEGRQEGGSLTFEKDFTLKYSDTGDNYDGVICTVKDIPFAHIATIWSLKNAPQAWLWNFTTERFDIPIIIDRESITKRKSRDRFFNVSIRFRYAEKIRIQTQ